MQGQRIVLSAVLDRLRRVLASPRDVPAMYGFIGLNPEKVLWHHEPLAREVAWEYLRARYGEVLGTACQPIVGGLLLIGVNNYSIPTRWKSGFM